jgi:hypothetical protein
VFRSIFALPCLLGVAAFAADQTPQTEKLERPRQALTRGCAEQLSLTTPKLILSEMSHQIDQGDWQGVRLLHGQLAKLKRTEAELIAQRKLLAAVPATEQPLPLDREVRYEVEVLNRMFRIDLNYMKLQDLFVFAQRWAKMEVQPRTLGLRDFNDETYLLRIFSSIGAPKQMLQTVAEAAVNARLKYFKERSAQGHHYEHEIDFRHKYALRQSMAYLSQDLTPAAIAYGAELLHLLLALELKGWGFSGEFIDAAVDNVSELLRQAVQGPGIEGATARAAFITMQPLIEGSYKTLKQLGPAAPERAGNVLAFRPARPLAWPTQTKILAKILETIDRWQ